MTRINGKRLIADLRQLAGRSHDIVEDTAEEDIILGCEVLAAVVERLEARLT